jgi:teichuronic acid biosynthesis glycosyltransferase TuaG
MSKVSIIMPAYNAAHYIAESINSVLSQTYTNWELVIIDDGSTDQTAAVAEEYVRKDNRIKCIRQKNGRQGKARNNGLRHATGTLIAFLDADDLWVPAKLELQVQALTAQNVDLVYSDAQIFIEGQPDHPKYNFDTVKGDFSGEIGLHTMIMGNRIPILTVLVYKTVIDAAGGFDERMEVQNCEDYHLWLKIMLKGYRLYGMNEILAHYRRHAASSSIDAFAQLPKEIFTLEDFTFKQKELNNLKVDRLKKKYRDLFHGMAIKEDRQGIKHYLKSFRQGLQMHETFYILSFLLNINIRLFKSFNWRLLSHK